METSYIFYNDDEEEALPVKLDQDGVWAKFPHEHSLTQHNSILVYVSCLIVDALKKQMMNIPDTMFHSLFLSKYGSPCRK